MNEVFVLLGGEDLKCRGLPAALDLPETCNASQAEVPGEESAEEIGELVVHAGDYRRWGAPGHS